VAYHCGRAMGLILLSLSRLEQQPELATQSLRFNEVRIMMG